jgi:hypothetical protein
VSSESDAEAFTAHLKARVKPIKLELSLRACGALCGALVLEMAHASPVSWRASGGASSNRSSPATYTVAPIRQSDFTRQSDWIEELCIGLAHRWSPSANLWSSLVFLTKVEHIAAHRLR